VGDPGQSRGSRDAIDVLVVALSLPDIGDVVDALKASRRSVDRAESPDRVAHDVVGGRPDVVVIDLRIGDGGNGLPDRILSWVCRNSSASALVITDPDQAEARIRALELGAADHVVAPLDVRECVARVDRLLAQRRKGRSGRIEVGDMTIDPAQRTATRNNELVSFTPRELALLLVLAQRPGEAVSKQDLLATVWHGEVRSENVVEANVSALRRKLHAVGPPVIHTVHRSGYVFRPVTPSLSVKRAAMIAERDRMVRERDAIIARRDELIHRLRSEHDPHRP
jgi:DNA-binding response OmpR family regulator